MAYINVDEVYILDNTGLQVDQTTDLPFKDAGLTESQQAQARKNIAAGGSNTNLLDNPWMTVNQRNIVGYTSTGSLSNIVDRWKMQGSCNVSSDGLVLKQASGTQGVLRQYIEVDRLKSGEVYTLSIMLQDGTIYSATGTLTASTSTTGWQIDATLISGRLLGGVRCYASTQVVWDIALTTSDESGVPIRAVKLELGSVSTLANDAPPDYGTELAKCQRYFVRLAPVQSGCIATGFSTSSNYAQFYNVTPYQMAKTSVTVSFSGTVNVRVGDQTNYAVTAITAETAQGVGVQLNCNTSGTFSQYTYARLLVTSGAYIDISADL